MSESEQPAQSWRESVARFLTIIGGIGLIFKGFVWVIYRFGLAQTASNLIPPKTVSMRVAAFVFEYWPVWVFALGIFMLACIRYGHPRSWIAKILPYLPARQPGALENIAAAVEASNEVQIQQVREQRAQIELSYDGDCRAPVTRPREDGSKVSGEIACLRVKCEAKPDISRCRAVLTHFEKNSESIMPGQDLSLRFWPGQNPGSDIKNIECQSAVYLETVWMPNDGEAEIMSEKFSTALAEHQTLDRWATYSLHLRFNADNALPTTAVLQAYCAEGVWQFLLKPPL